VAAEGEAPPPNPLPIAMERGRKRHGPDFREYVVQVVEYTIDGEAQDCVVKTSEVGVSLRIVFALRLVDFPVNL
jgi:hypothetical protein